MKLWWRRIISISPHCYWLLVMLQIRASAGSPRVPGDRPRPRRPHAQSGGSRVLRPQHWGQQRLRAEPGLWSAPARPRTPASVPPQVPSGQSVPRPRPPVHQPRPPGGQAASAQEPGPDVLWPGRAPAVYLGVTAPAAGAAPAPVHHQLPVQPGDLSGPGPGPAFPRPATPSHAPQQSVQLTVQSPGAARHNQLEGLLPLLVRTKFFWIDDVCVNCCYTVSTSQARVWSKQTVSF